MAKDWTGSAESIFRMNGCSNHSKTGREVHDLYVTDPPAVEALLGVESFDRCVWECAVGLGIYPMC